MLTKQGDRQLRIVMGVLAGAMLVPILVLLYPGWPRAVQVYGLFILGPIVLGMVVWVLLGGRREVRRIVRADYLLCPECGYDLHELPDDGTCPECGREFMREEVRVHWHKLIETMPRWRKR